MAKIALKNLDRNRTFTGMEFHDQVCHRRNQCKCMKVRTLSPGGKRVARKVPVSFQILPGAELELDLEVLHVGAVKKAVDSGWLKLTRLEAPPPAHAPAKSGKAKSGRASTASDLDK